MKPWSLVAVVVVVATAAAGCLAKDPGPSGLYRGKQASIHPVVMPKGAPVTWGSAPVIDDHYGGTLYAGTAIEQTDPRPAALANGNEPLRLWVADSHDGRTNRPAILWFHGGGFAVGIDSMYGLANGTAKDYAQRGYVGRASSNARRVLPSLLFTLMARAQASRNVWRSTFRPAKAHDGAALIAAGKAP